MAIITNGAGVIVGSMTVPECMFYIFSFLRTNSQWQIIGSGDGTSGGMGTPASPIDVYNAASDWSNNNFWFVWQLGTALQMLVQRVGTAYDFEVYTNLALDYTGGSATVRPTSPSGSSIKLNLASWLMNVPTNGRAFMLCDNGNTIATAGWFYFSRNFRWGDQINGSSFGFIPLSNVQSGDQHPYVMAMQEALSSVDSEQCYARITGLNVGLLHGIDPAAPTTSTSFLAGVPGHYYPTDHVTPGTRNMGQAPDGKDWHQACVVFRPRGQYKGFTTFLQRPGTTRIPGTTYANRTRISLGAYSVPWDGVSLPEQS